MLPSPSLTSPAPASCCYPVSEAEPSFCFPTFVVKDSGAPSEKDWRLESLRAAEALNLDGDVTNDDREVACPGPVMEIWVIAWRPGN